MPSPPDTSLPLRLEHPSRRQRLPPGCRLLLASLAKPLVAWASRPWTDHRQDARATCSHATRRFTRALLLLAAAVLTYASPAASVAATNTISSVPPQGYTNHAGHVLAGTLVSADARHVTLRLPGGATRSLPLSIFPPSERERIGIESGTLAPPPAVAEACERCRLALQRLDVLVKVGQQSEESADERRDLERRAVRAIIADLEKEQRLSPAAAAYFTDRVP